MSTNAEPTDETAIQGNDMQVLEFQLGGETYCVEIEYVAEIVDMGELTAIPNSPPHIEGVMDLRGRTTSIVNPRRVLNVSGEEHRKRIIVFDPDEMPNEEAVGWIVDEVDQVTRITGENLDEPPASAANSITGIVKREDGFVMWIDPETLRT
jgi:purine-binding chemotaxis protein CheW